MTGSCCWASFSPIRSTQAPLPVSSSPLSRPIRRLSPPLSTTPSRLPAGLIDMLVDITGDGMAIAVVAPFLCPIRIVFAFPDGRFMFYAIDDIPVGRIGLAAMGGGRDHDDGRVADGHPAGAVLGDRCLQGPTLPGRGQDLRDHRSRQGCIGLIFQGGYRPALVIVAHLSAEEYDGAGARVMGPAKQADDVKRLAAEGLRRRGLSGRGRRRAGWVRRR